jgi:hypothetical protein
MLETMVLSCFKKLSNTSKQRDALLESTTDHQFLVLLHFGNESHLEQQQSKMLYSDWSKRTSPMAPHWIAKAGNPSHFLFSQILSMIELAMP